ncbi:hypothetical protein [Saccharopolyspora shandongensis]|uniref:hypothetical protein n=1 Tax=Saccharopolyspora shandongensis TaxID=418495 RepID=UPI0033E81FA9
MSEPKTGTTAVADFVWVHLPAAVSRLSVTLGFALRDGDYLRAWPPAAIVMPPAALLVGALLGAVHPGPTYTFSAIAIGVLAVVAGLGAGLGCWAWLGFVLADLFLGNRSTLPGFAGYGFGTQRLMQGYLPLAVSYLVLAVLLVLAPVLARGLALRTTAVLRAHRGVARTVELALSAVLFAVLTYAWTQATAFLIRPLWSFSGETPTTAAIQPLQQHAVALAVAAFCAGACRGALAMLAADRAPITPTSPRQDRGHSSARTILRIATVPIQAAFLTLLMAGLIASPSQGTLVWLALCVILYARLLLIPRIPVYPALIRRIPLLARLAVAVALSYLLATLLVEPAAQRGETSFVSTLVVLLLSLAAASLLMPAPPPTPTTRPAHPTGPSPTTPGASPPAVPPRHGPETPTGSTGPAQTTMNKGPPGALRHWVYRSTSAGTITGGLLAATAPSAAADNCSTLSDCSAGVKIALGLAALGLVLVGAALVAEVLAETMASGFELGEVLETAQMARDTQAAAGGMTLVASEETAAAATLAEVDASIVGQAAVGGTVTAESTIGSGAVPAGSKLARVLQAINTGFNATVPRSSTAALQVIDDATASVGLEPGIGLGATARGSLALMNKGGITTFIFNNGQILIMKGAQVLLNLI